MSFNNENVESTEVYQNSGARRGVQYRDGSDADSSSPVNGALKRLNNDIEELGAVISRLGDQLSFVSNDHPIPKPEKMAGMDKPGGGDSPLLEQIHILGSDLRNQRERILHIIDKLDV